jgi:hypothetical protein
VAWRPLADRPLTQRTAGVWPSGRPSHPAAPHFAELAARVLARDRTVALRRDNSPRPSAGPPRPWSVVYDERS